MSAQRPLRLRIETAAPLDPLLLRAAIVARLGGRAFPGRGEDDVGRRVAEAVQERLRGRRP